MKGLSDDQEETPRGEHGEEEEAKVGWYDLFFDLCMVTVIARIAMVVEVGYHEEIHEHHESAEEGDEKVLRTFFGLDRQTNSIFVAFMCGWMAYRAWSYETIVVMRSARGDDLIGRTLGFFFLVSLCLLSSSVGAVTGSTAGVGEHFLLFGAITPLFPIFKGIRIGIHNEIYRRKILPSQCVHISTIVVYILSAALLGHNAQAIVFISCEVVMLTVNMFLTIRNNVHVHPEYINERMGVFVIVILGEMVATIVNASGNNNRTFAHEFGGTVLSAIIVYSMWWVYFDSVARDPDVYNHSTRGFLAWLVFYVFTMSTTILAAVMVIVLTHVNVENMGELDRPVVRALCFSFASAMTCQSILRVLYQWNGEKILKYSSMFSWCSLYSVVMFTIPMCLPLKALWHGLDIIAILSALSFVRIVAHIFYTSSIASTFSKSTTSVLERLRRGPKFRGGLTTSLLDPTANQNTARESGRDEMADELDHASKRDEIAVHTAGV